MTDAAVASARPDHEAAQAMLLGLALGDALGWPVEFLDKPSILVQFGRSGILEPPDPALPSPWLRRLENYNYLVSLAHRRADAKCRLHA